VASFVSTERSAPSRALHSFPTRRSSDLCRAGAGTISTMCNLGADSLPTTHEASVKSCTVPQSEFVADYRSARSRSRSTLKELMRSEEHTSELQSPDHLVCRLLLEKKNNR